MSDKSTERDGPTLEELEETANYLRAYALAMGGQRSGTDIAPQPVDTGSRSLRSDTSGDKAFYESCRYNGKRV